MVSESGVAACCEVREVLGPTEVGFLPGNSKGTASDVFGFPLSDLSFELFVPRTGTDGCCFLVKPLPLVLPRPLVSSGS